MRRLLIDIGNSRLKWCLARGRRRATVRAGASRAGALPLSAVRMGSVRSLTLPARADAVHTLRRLLRAAGRVDEIWVSNVAGGELQLALRVAARALAMPRPHFVLSARRMGGVRNGYRDVWRLGVDRWLALIGARARHPLRPLCIVNAGTALTIDLLDTQGVHRGGLIAPGPALMQSALLRETAGIRRRAGAAARGAKRDRGSASRSFFARGTRRAVEQGAAGACAALIDRSAAEASRLLGTPAIVLLGGGAAAALRPLLRARTLHAPDLVLRGLAVLSQG